MDNAKATISGIFAQAERMNVLDQEELDGILNEYPQAIADKRENADKERAGEAALYDRAEEMIKKHTASDE